MLKFSTAAAALAILAACSASASVPAQQVFAEAPAAAPASESVMVADLAGAPEAEITQPPTQRTEHVRDESAHARLPVSCDIRTRRTGNGLLIEAIARADEPLSGDYELVIRTSGGGNASDLTQAGPFAAGHGRFVTLGQSEIAFDRGARLDATLTLRGENGETCRRDMRL